MPSEVCTWTGPMCVFRCLPLLTSCAATSATIASVPDSAKPAKIEHSASATTEPRLSPISSARRARIEAFVGFACCSAPGGCSGLVG